MQSSDLDGPLVAVAMNTGFYCAVHSLPEFVLLYRRHAENTYFLCKYPVASIIWVYFVSLYTRSHYTPSCCSTLTKQISTPSKQCMSEKGRHILGSL